MWDNVNVTILYFVEEVKEESWEKKTSKLKSTTFYFAVKSRQVYKIK